MKKQEKGDKSIQNKLNENEYKHQLETLAQTANAFLTFSPEIDIYNFIGNTLLNQVPNSYIIIYEIINNEKSVYINSLFGFNPKLLKGLKNIFGFDLKGATIPLIDKHKDRLKEARLIFFENKQQLLRKDLPYEEMEEVVNYLKIKKVLTIGMVEGDRLFGGVDIISPDIENITVKEHFIEAFIRQASLAINRQAIDKELILSKEKAEESDRLKTAFLANMSHEIRTPMNAILGFSQLLKHPSLSEEKRTNYLNIIDDKGNDLLRILNDLIDISLIESGQMTIVKKDFSVNSLLAELYMHFSTKMKSGVSFSVEKAKPNELSYINSDPVRIKQIFTNLLNNAVKYTLEGYIQMGYRFTEDKKLEFYVKDSGVGIPKEMHKAVFKRFYQVSKNLIRSYSGNGLGLTICKELTEFMGGEIRLESIENEGSAFCFTIPYEVTSGNNKSQNEGVNTEFIDLEGKTILVAEDDEANYDYIYEILNSCNASVLWAKDGLEAINIYNNKNNNIDLILMDLKMPRMGGIDAIGQIREIDVKVPIIAQTAYAMEGDKEQCLKMGCNNYITKPLKRKALLKMIDQYL